MEVGKGSKANLFMACLFESREEGRREGVEGRQKERKRGREAQAQENRRGEGLDIHFRIPPLGICFLTPAPLCAVTLRNLTKADNYAFSTRPLPCL